MGYDDIYETVLSLQNAKENFKARKYPVAGRLYRRVGNNKVVITVTVIIINLIIMRSSAKQDISRPACFVDTG